MRSPSVQALVKAFPKELDAAKARLIKKIAKATDDSLPEYGGSSKLETLIEECCPETLAYVRSLHSSPYGSHMWRVTVALHAMDKILGTYGVEGLGPDMHGPKPPPYEYLNTGDSYNTTLIYKRSTDNLFIGNWGDIAERHPNW